MGPDRNEDGVAMTQRRVVVSGGGTGIGLATAEAFAADGDRLVLLGRREDVLRKAADALNGRFGEATATWCAADLSDPEQVGAVRDFVTADETPVDVLVANAGGNVAASHDGTLASVADGYRRNFEANVLTAVLLTEALLPHIRRPGGRIVQLSSIACCAARDRTAAPRAGSTRTPTTSPSASAARASPSTRSPPASSATRSSSATARPRSSWPRGSRSP